jgi:16S rRNA (cytidine1402-2'-O)-methyltransferase
MGTLYIVATPIGNLKDITIRAIEVLQSIPVVACEDTRRTGILLKHIRDTYPTPNEQKPHLISYFEQNEFRRVPELIEILKSGVSVAVVSDAGTPLVSDPGYRLVNACIEQGITVQAVPGASSVLTALSVSGLPSDKFLFLGYPPHKSGHRKKLYESLKDQTISSTTIMLEAPHKVLKTLLEMQDVFGDITIVVCRELTKVYEEVRREKISESITHFEKITPKGEFTILFHLS